MMTVIYNCMSFWRSGKTWGWVSGIVAAEQVFVTVITFIENSAFSRRE